MAPRARHLRPFSSSACEFDPTCRSAGRELPQGGQTEGRCCARQAGFGAAEPPFKRLNARDIAHLEHQPPEIGRTARTVLNGSIARLAPASAALTEGASPNRSSSDRNMIEIGPGLQGVDRGC
jgi:hypothetical protein